MEGVTANRNQFVEWIVELQSFAQAGLTYEHDSYDLERYSRIREISAEMLANLAELPVEKVQNLFCRETGYQTPKIDTRAAIFDGDRILLVRESNGEWALPGGWCDVNQSIAENTIKEAREEAGLAVTADRLIAVQDRNRHNAPAYAYGIVNVFVLCSATGGSFQPNIETTESGYFPLNALPENLALEKTTREQIELCFRAKSADNWIVPFD